MSKNPSEKKRMPGEGQDWNKDKEKDKGQDQQQQHRQGEPTGQKREPQHMEQDRTKQGPAHHREDTQAGDEGIDDRKRRPA